MKKSWKKEIFRGLTSLFSLLLIVTTFVMTSATKIPSVINGLLGVDSRVEVIDSEDTSADTIYYTTGLDSDDVYDTDALNSLEKSAADEIVAQEEEGAVLLKNDNNALPLKEGSNVTLLGAATIGYYNGVYYSKLSIDYYDDWTEEYEGYSTDKTIVEALEETYHVNTGVLDAYEEYATTYPGRGVTSDAIYAYYYTPGSDAPSEDDKVVDGEAPASFYEDGLSDSFSSYGDAAIISLSRDQGEDNDLGMTGGVDGISELALQPNERELFEMVQSYKEVGIFSKVIVLLNTNNAMELGELDDYGVDAILWVGNLGSQGATGVANILTGKVSPSGHLVDTYATDSLSAPASMNANDNSQYWANADEILEYCGYNEADYSGEQNYSSYIVEAEGIYVGYKYYETRYEDCILGQGNASGTAGTYASTAGWNYNEEVVYPFGFGLSYTTFEQKLDGVTYNPDTDSYEVEVTVTNTGDTYSGKSVVQVYAQTPYGDYEKQYGVEKSAVQLVGFAKTDELAPGESETVTVEAERYFLASYDANGEEGYILSAGNYYLAVGDDAHDALNNILAAKGAEGMTDIYGNSTSGNTEKVYSWVEKERDTTTYATSRVDDSVEVTNQLEEANINYWIGDTVTYLSRSDWEGTYPITYSGLSATEEMMEQIKGTYEQPEDSASAGDYEQGVDNGITFAMMKDIDYDDDEVWEQFLNQFTVEEMLTLVADGQGTEAIVELGIPSVSRADDGSGIGSAGFLADPDGGYAQRWNSEMVTSSTFNVERFEERGRILGLEAYFTGYNEVWYGGGNLHRTSFGGRNNQYYSEDGTMGYIVGAHEAQGMQSVGVTYCIKHFAGNDQETNRESISTFFNEQAFRENALRAFEGAIVEGNAYGVMTGFSRIGCQYAGYTSSLLIDILRNEWGFEGHVTSDAAAGSLYKQNWVLAMTSGLDYFCMESFVSAMGGGEDAVTAMTKAIADGDGYALSALRTATKNNVNAYLHTFTVNGLSAESVMVVSVPWWEYALYGMIAVFALLTLGSLAGYICLIIKENRRKCHE